MNPFAGLLPLADRPCVLAPVAARPKKPSKPQKAVKHRRAVEYVPNPFELTPSEYSVLPLLVQGYSTNEIGAALGISGKTVERHTHSARRKMNARSTLQVAVLYDRWVRANQETT